MSKALKTAKDVSLSPTRFGALEPQNMGEKLPFDYKLPMLAKNFHQLPRMSKLNTILDLSEPEEFLRQLPAQEVHHLVHHIGIEDAAVLVPHTTTEQFQALLDLDLWVGSRFEATRFERWMWALDEYGDASQLCKRVWDIDAETIITILMKWTRIHLVEGEDDMPDFPDESEVFNSPDQRFQIEVFGDAAQRHFPTVFRLIQALYANKDLDEVHAMLDRVTSDLPNEVEEDLLKFRNARLEDIGFLPSDEALTMYEYMDPEEAREKLNELLSDAPLGFFSHEEAPMGTRLMALSHTRNFLADVLATVVEREHQQQFIVSFSYLCNRAFSTGSVDLSDIDTLDEEARTVFGRLNIAVEYLSGGNLEKGGNIVRHMHMVYIHRIGSSLCEQQGRQARWILATLGNREARHLYDTPFDEVLTANARMLPEYPEVLSDSTSLVIRPYKNLEEVRRVETELRKLRLVTDFLSQTFGLKATGEADPSIIDLENETIAADTRLSSLWLTVLAHHDQGEALALTPVSQEDAALWAQGVLSVPTSEDAVRALQVKSTTVISSLEVSDEDLLHALGSALISPAVERLVENLYGVQPADFDPNVLSDLFMIG
jgi:hypothetical protein